MNDVPEITGGGMVAQLQRTAGVEVSVSANHAEVCDQINRMPGQPDGEPTWPNWKV
ncbi:MAG: hypothetical protein WCH99_18500 [Verrucomicrobiota bacterium]